MQHCDVSMLSKVGYLSALHSLSKIPPSSLASLFCRNFTIYKRSIAEIRVNCQNQIQRTKI